MTSILLKRLQRDPKFQKREQPPAPAIDTSALNSAIEQLVRQAAAAGAEEAVKQSKPRTIQEQFDAPPLSSEFPPPPRTKPPKDFTAQIQRDELRRIKSITIGTMVFNIQRGADGRATRMVASDIGDPTTVPPAPLNRA